MKFKKGDKVKILPSAVDIGVKESEVGRVVKVTNPLPSFSVGILISDSRGEEYGCWCVNDYDITPFIEIGQQLLLWDDV